jgi:hypothetical protein
MYRFLPQLQAPWRGLSRLILVEHMTSKTVDVEYNAYQSTATGLSCEFVGMDRHCAHSWRKLAWGESDAAVDFMPTQSVQWFAIELFPTRN